MLRQECKLVKTAEGILLGRRRRHEEFDSAMFGEPAWDMLLELYVQEASGASSSAEQLQSATATASSTAARWLKYLENEGLVARRNYPQGGGGVFVELTSRGRHALDQYLAAIGS